GTLAPIVSHPDRARVSKPVARELERLSLALPVAVISGRRVADVLPRLGFVPRFVVGNHGAEDPGDPASAHWPSRLDDLRERLARAAQRLTGAGVWVEDKGHSLALHFRQAPDAAVATDRINEVLVDLDPSLRCFGGKLVVNVVCAEAPDKADSLAALMARADAHSALFVGDDVNDEVVFARHHRHWLCVRVGRDDPQSQADFFLDRSSEMRALLARIRQLRVPA
nr:trehalose-phosphatase [Burkholderiaceae bacterium]